MAAIDFEQDLLAFFKKQLKAKYGMPLKEVHFFDLLGIVTYDEFMAVDYMHMSMEELAAWFEGNNKGNYSPDDIQLWRINNMLLMVRETAKPNAKKSKPEIFGIYCTDED